MNPKGNPQNLKPWKPGESGNPEGRPPKEESLTEVLRSKIDKDEIADKLIELGKAGNVVALKYLYDRCDGAPRQTVDSNVRKVPGTIGYEYDDFAQPADTEDTPDGEAAGDEA